MKKNDVLVFGNKDSPPWERLWDSLGTVPGVNQLVLCSTLEELSNHLVNRSFGHSIIALLLVETYRELEQIAAMNRPLFFREVKMILVLPDHDPQTTNLGLGLQPRFMTYQDFNFEEIAAVLSRMISKSEYSSAPSIRVRITAPR